LDDPPVCGRPRIRGCHPRPVKLYRFFPRPCKYFVFGHRWQPASPGCSRRPSPYAWAVWVRATGQAPCQFLPFPEKFPGNLPALPPAGAWDDGTKSFTFSLFFSIIYVNTFTLREI